MGKCLVLFVEGETEIEFYKAVINFAREKRAHKKFNFSRCEPCHFCKSKEIH